jgi:hypothetical protein
MGTSLYNKIPLGRGSALDSTPVRALLLMLGLSSIGVAWLVLRALQ